MGHFLADQQYGDNSNCTGEQNICYSDNYISGLSSQLMALENFDPNLTTDPFRWIPKGLFYDLMDDRNDQGGGRVNLNDIVSGYTNQEFFNSLDSDINDLEEYRQRLLQENGNYQATGVNSIFNFYGD